jgi:hypothetical protein
VANLLHRLILTHPVALSYVLSFVFLMGLYILGFGLGLYSILTPCPRHMDWSFWIIGHGTLEIPILGWKRIRKWYFKL